ncbi:TPA: hypothetical protein ACX6NS_000205 [Photobacterium damselae]
MAAEKLTKGRLIQILVLMTVLIAAFTWRTVSYETHEQKSELAKECDLTVEPCLFDKDASGVLVTLSQKQPKAEAPLTVVIDNMSAKPTAIVEGVSMNMGTVPVIFEQKEDKWVGSFTVPACKHETMVWAIKITEGSFNITANFTVKK